MNERTQSLFSSLVGSSIEFRFKEKMSGVLSIDPHIQSVKKKIAQDVEMALAVGGKLCVMLLSELTYFYMHEMYYMAVRSSIEMRRYRPTVLEYMELPVQERANRLKNVLSEGLKTDKNRDIKIVALKYFLSTYPGRIKEFKGLLTREEYMMVI